MLPPPPEASSGWTRKPGWTFRKEAVAAAHPAAAQAGADMLRLGGSAVDAAIAAQLVLGLVEPQSSGIGGGAFLLVWDGQRVVALDGRETAPAAAREDLFLRPDGTPWPFQEAVQSGLSVGVPGVMRLLEEAHRRYGRLAWPRLFQPAIRLAQEGFEMSPRLHRLIESELGTRSALRVNDYLLAPNGRPWPVGHRLRNPAYAAVLRTIAKSGAQAFYRGAIAADIVRQVQQHPQRPGAMTLADLAAYRVREREAFCHDWRVYRLCGFPPPGSGAIAIAQMLGMLERQPGRVMAQVETGAVIPEPDPGVAKREVANAGSSSQYRVQRSSETPGIAGAEPQEQPRGSDLHHGVPGPEFLHRYTEVARLAFADRALYLADPDFVPAPAGDWRQLIAPAYLDQRAALVGERSLGEAKAGRPGDALQAFAPQGEQPEHGTSHLSVIDARGMAVSMTTTIEAQFGSRLMSDGDTGLRGGFFLNNELTDFSLKPRDEQGQPVANRVEPGKRPRSAMSPTLVFRLNGQGAQSATGPYRLVMSTGSPGGAAIIHYVAKSLLGTLAWGLDAQQTLDLPNFGSYNGPTVLETGRFPASTVEALKARGHKVLETELTSGAQLLMWREDGTLRGAADGRREGEVKGR